MNLCDDNHEQVCFDALNCPLCAAIADTEKANEEIVRLETVISELNEEIKQHTE